MAIREQQADQDPRFSVNLDHFIVSLNFARLAARHRSRATVSHVLPGPAVQLCVCARPDARNATRAMARHPRPRWTLCLFLPPRTPAADAAASLVRCTSTPSCNSSNSHLRRPRSLTLALREVPDLRLVYRTRLRSYSPLSRLTPWRAAWFATGHNSSGTTKHTHCWRE